MILKIKSKILCAFLTASLALSPVCMAPAWAADEQDVESEADSWRYQDGEIIAEEDVSFTDADEELLEDYNAQMGSSQEEEQTEESEMSAQSATKKNKYWTWGGGKYKRGPGYLKGIDVSYWQGSIDWKKVKKAGVDFAIIRCGYGPNKSSKDDSRFAGNVAGCEKYGIPYGVYIYSYAHTVSQAKDEADHAIRLLKKNKCKLSYPVYYDLEDRQVARASNATIVKMANAFCKKLSKKGYAPGVYANLSWWETKLSKFKHYDRWVAQWNKKCTYTKDYSIWQCTSSAGVKGISGRVDANLLMIPKARMDDYMRYSGVRYTLVEENGNTYAVDSWGNKVKNKFIKIEHYTYGFGKDGIMVKDRKCTLKHKTYILDRKGRAYINKSKTLKDAPYYSKKGKGKIGTLKKGTKFYVLRTSGDWSKMADGNWIKTSLTKKTVRYPDIEPSKTVNYKAVVKEKTASYSGPSRKYIKKKTFKKGVTVKVIGTYKKWSKVSTGQWLPTKKLRKK